MIDDTPEPIEIKNGMKELMINMMKLTSEKWDWQSLAVWGGNKLPRYLWTDQGWKNELTKKGWNWQGFLSMLSKQTHEMIRWANDELEWKDFLKIIKADLVSDIISRIYTKL